MGGVPVKTPRRLLRYVREHPGASWAELRRELGIKQATLCTTVRRLRDVGLLERPIKNITMGKLWPKGYFSRAEPTRRRRRKRGYCRYHPGGEEFEIKGLFGTTWMCAECAREFVSAINNFEEMAVINGETEIQHDR